MYKNNIIKLVQSSQPSKFKKKCRMFLQLGFKISDITRNKNKNKFSYII